MRILAHKILFNNQTYLMSVAEFSDDNKEVTIKKFREELPETIFINGTVQISKKEDGTYTYCPVFI